ncbi:MAG: Rpn family recombination-promoting nuclease/putative transposase [Muribaculaceae bacterium]|nr:Rpn family recombination-promoting nuclease/putative transposase [Muribaculaceae bacterium]
MQNDDNYIRFDWAMKHMLRDKANFGILEGLITVLLGEKIHIEEILESESNQEDSQDKFNRVDIKAKNSKGHLIIVEVQLTRQLYYLQRILYGTCKAITEHINIGDKYDQVKKVYSISILYCDFGQGDDYVYHGETKFTGIHTGNELLVNMKEDGVIVQHLPRKVFPEYYLVRVNVYDRIPETPLDEWMTYLKTGKIKEDTRTPGLQEVKEKLRVLSMSEKEKRAYFAHIDNIMVQNDVLDTARDEGRAEGLAEGLAKGKEEGLAEGHAKGLEEGLLKGRAEMLRRLYRSGMTIGEISVALGISEEEVRKVCES